MTTLASALPSAQYHPRPYQVGSHPFEEVFGQYYSVIRRYLCSKVGDSAMAEELTSQTFERVLRFGHRYQEENLKAWLLKVAKNTFINFYRREKRIREFEQYAVVTGQDFRTMGDYSQAPTPEQMVLRKRTLEELVQNVPSEYREIFACREVEDLAYQEIAEKLKIPVGTVMSSLHRARKHLRNYQHAQER